ncbi:sensor histidine kinase [Lysobacter panacisoli]|uniref:histidine kinase n=1 Tax=Lysobacter panacisoli TaxID=1255263 RepID=A0ABP9LSP1_9GAMM|nr:ATP-binding protein [Lysobacter panacisoli]
MQPKRHFSLAGKLTLLLFAAMCGAVVLGALLIDWFDNALLGASITLLLCAIVTPWIARRCLARQLSLFRALSGSVASFRDGDFSFSVARRSHDELDDLVEAHNELGRVLREERQSLFQRELLLDTVVQNTPTALLLIESRGAIVYGNVAARQLFHDGRKVEGLRFEQLMEHTPGPLREALGAGRDRLFSFEHAGQEETYHLARRDFQLNGRVHTLYMFKRLTAELNRQEVATWKKVIRVISHELNNSLAPITSLAHSGAELLRREDYEKLGRIFETIEERARHLHGFLRAYSSVAKLPVPELERVDWAPFLSRLQQHYAFTRGAIPGEAARFDPAQVEQALINVLKNAHESGSAVDEVVLSVRQLGRIVRVEVSDRGPGMSESVLANALVPFYSTKRTGSGLGLALAREIAEAHGGRIALANRDGGGLTVSLTLPVD